jgi:hypothetical protein
VTVCGGYEEVLTWVISLSLLVQGDISKEGYSPKSGFTFEPFLRLFFQILFAFACTLLVFYPLFKGIVGNERRKGKEKFQSVKVNFFTVLWIRNFMADSE